MLNLPAASRLIAFIYFQAISKNAFAESAEGIT
jgi:hypothetical protein